MNEPVCESFQTVARLSDEAAEELVLSIGLRSKLVGRPLLEEESRGLVGIYNDLVSIHQRAQDMAELSMKADLVSGADFWRSTVFHEEHV